MSLPSSDVVDTAKSRKRFEERHPSANKKKSLRGITRLRLYIVRQTCTPEVAVRMLGVETERATLLRRMSIPIYRLHLPCKSKVLTKNLNFMQSLIIYFAGVFSSFAVFSIVLISELRTRNQVN